MAGPLAPTLAADLFLPLQEELVGVLRGLPAGAWDLPTTSRHWRVREIAAHILDGQLRRISTQRDGHPPPPPAAPIRENADLVRFLGELNASFVEMSRRLSPRLLIELLEWAGPRLAETARAADPYAAAVFAVSWAGEARSAAWFDLARDLTEHWHHQQQIRLAAGDLSTRVAVGGLSETATLGAAFNEMAGQLEVEASQRDQLDRLKDEFVLTASHELRSPLTSVQGFAELLMLERDSLTDKQVETVEIILDNCRHLARLLNDLLDLARSDAGRLAITPKPTAVAALIDDAVRTMRAQTETAHQTLTQRVEPGLPLVDVEADRIRQILVNLLTNAHDYSAEGASIEVTARPRGAEVEIAVTDDGPGIPESQLDLIFQRFTRGDAGLTQRVGGTGLGLAISKSLVELHGGTIEAESTVGVGSSFRFRLPATGVAAADPSAAATEAS